MIYANTYELLERQLPRMRRKPRMVYFSTACEPFVPNETALELLYKSMRLLLEHGVGLLISSKSAVPANFVDLFSRYSRQVFVQIGLTTANDGVRRLIEPKAADVAARLETLSRLREIGVACEARADPIIPGLTDTDENLSGLFSALRDRGIRQAVISYLFLRSATARALADLQCDGFSFRHAALPLYTKTIERYCGEGIIRAIDTDYRTRKYEQFRELARTFGLRLRLCRCKNPDVTTECCMSHASSVPDTAAQQQQLSFGD